LELIAERESIYLRGEGAKKMRAARARIFGVMW
jgi:hypothetical protein